MKKTIRDYEINNKIVIIRCDFNVTILNNKIVDNTRIKASLKTIKYALDHKAKVLLLSHIGRVKTKEDKEKYNLYPVAKELSSLLNKEITFIPTTRKASLRELIENAEAASVFMLQNTRWEDLNNNKESSCDDELSRYFASLGDIFINDAFATLHRKHASNAGIAKYLTSGIGFLVEEELSKLSILNENIKPYIVIMGGSKISDKIDLINNIIPKASYLLVGGALANTFLKANHQNIGSSLYEESEVASALNLISKYKDKIIIPSDFLVENNNVFSYKDEDSIESNDKIIDLGPHTIERYESYLKDAKMIFFNGPVGVYEKKEARRGTESLIKASLKEGAKLIIGGGDILAAAEILGLKDQVYHASTGGGATLTYLAGKPLPSLELINDK